MKIQAISNNKNIKKSFFIFMIVPLLIGLMISLTNLARAEWNSTDHLLNNSPKTQGWKEIQIYRSPSTDASENKSSVEPT
jgi:hypothetical protein